MRKFIVTLDVGTREQRNAITELFQSKNWQLWHWMEDVWLLSEVPDTVTSREIAEEMNSIPLVQYKRKLILRVPEGMSTYYGNNPKESWNWMARFWGRAG